MDADIIARVRANDPEINAITLDEWSAGTAALLVDILEHNTHVACLQFLDCDISAAEFDVLLVVLARMYWLEFDRTPFPPAGLLKLLVAVQNQKLTYLHISNVNLGDAAATDLAFGYPYTIMHLILNQCNFGVLATNAFAERLRSGTNIIHLNLDNNNIGPAGASALLAALASRGPRSTNLEVLSLRAIGMTPANGAELANVVRTNEHLQSLTISDNTLDLATLELLADAVVNRPIHTINMANVSGVRHAMIPITRILENATELRAFDISINNLGNAMITPDMRIARSPDGYAMGANIDIFANVVSRSKLIDLSMLCTLIDNNCVMKLAEEIRKSRTLKHIGVGMNLIGSDAIINLMRGTRLDSLYAEHCNLSQADGAHIAAFLETYLYPINLVLKLGNNISPATHARIGALMLRNERFAAENTSVAQTIAIANRGTRLPAPIWDHIMTFIRPE